MFYPVFLFLVCAAVIIYCGIRLSKYGDIIADKSGMGKAWFGLILMSFVTSLPELISGLSAILIVDAPDLAIGDVVGSCMFNILILSVLDYFYTEGPISSRVQQSQILGAGFGVIIITLVLGAFIFEDLLPVLGWISCASLAFITMYFVAIRTIYVYERNRKPVTPAAETHAVEAKDISLKEAIKWYLLNAAFVVLAAVFLPHAAEQIAAETGLGQTFVGTLLMAASTSLPELVVSISALRIGAIDIAVGNLFGSNLFNIFILAIDDIAYVKGSLLEVASRSNQISLVAVLIMTGIAIIGLIFQQQHKRWKMAVDTFAILCIYLVTVVVLYYTRNL